MQSRLLFLGKLFIVGCCAYISAPSAAFAYEDSLTHPALTSEIVSFYNASYPQDQISASERAWIMEGSTKEDAWPRWINHLFDPIHHTAWTGAHTGSFRDSIVRAASALFLAPVAPLSAPTWLHDYTAQESYKRYGGNHAWQKGLEEAASGDARAAYTTLGHALHLLEDMGVPEHARDDTHAHAVRFLTGDIGSPYEAYAERWTPQSLSIANDLFDAGLRPVDKARPEEFLVEMARYSNKYFFSKDTINDPRYSAPRIVREANGIAYGLDENAREFPLARISTVIGNNGTPQAKYVMLDTAADAVVFDAYFEHLSERILMYGAGMIKLFRNEARKAETASGIGRSVFRIISPAGEAKKVFDVASGVIAGLPQWLNDAYRSATRAMDTLAKGTTSEKVSSSSENFSPLEEQGVDNRFPETLMPVSSKGTSKKSASGNASTTKTLASSTAPLPKTPALSPEAAAMLRPCDSRSTQSPSRRVLINEVAWMGGVASANDEWIELKNPNTTSVDLHGWQMHGLSGAIQYIIDRDNDLVRSTHLESSGLYILERTDDTSIPGVLADAIYVGGLSNTSASTPEGLRLYDATCALVDEVFANSGSGHTSWPAGDAAARKTMERDSVGFGWHTSTKIGGTPNLPNSSGTILAPPLPAAPPPPTAPPPAPSTSTLPATTTIPQLPEMLSLASATIHISELQVSGVDAGDEFIELYNPHDEPVDLSGGSLQYVSGGSEVSVGTVSKKNIDSGSIIPARGFFLIARGTDTGGDDGYRGDVTPDMSHRSFTLSGNTAGGTVFLVATSEALGNATDPRIIDRLPYEGMVPEANGSLERKAFSGGICISAAPGMAGEFLGNGCAGHGAASFELRANPDPQNTSSMREPGSTTPGGSTSTPPVSNFIDAVSFSVPSSPSSSVRLNLSLNASAQPMSDPSVPSWLVVVPYLNKRPEGQRTLTTLNDLALHVPNRLRISYDGCHGGETVSHLVIVPLFESACQPGGALSGAYRYNQYAEDHYFHGVLTATDGVSFVPEDYLTFALYSFAGGGGGKQDFSLQAIDAREYPLRHSSDTALPPSSPTQLSVSLDALHQSIILSWLAASDPDSLDDVLNYEVSLEAAGVTSSSWQLVKHGLSATLPVAFGTVYELHVRAIDEMGLRSVPSTITWSAPHLPALPAQMVHTEVIGGSDGGRQSILLPTPISLRSMAFWILSSGPFCCSTVATHVYKDTLGQPGELMGISVPQSVAQNAGNQEVRFFFSDPLRLSAGRYWFVPVADSAKNSIAVYGATQDPYQDGGWSQNEGRDAYFRLEVL